jgi:hypothetical protein
MPGRKVAEKIEIQTRHQAQLYNVDVDRTSATWPSITPSPAETRMNPGSRPILMHWPD